MVGVPELFLERCLSSISCSDGSLYIHTVVEMQRVQERRRKEIMRRGGTQRGDNREQIEEMDVHTETRSGFRL